MQAQSINEVLDNVLTRSGLQYRIFGKQVVVYKNEAKSTPMLSPAVPEVQQQREIVIKGKVVDAQNQTMPGVTIVLKGTTRGVTTDIDGNFTFNLQSGDLGKTLQVSYVGFQTEEIKIEDERFLNIVLSEDIGLMDELVVIGYGSKDRKSLTSSISSMKNEDVERLAATIPSVDGMLGGVIKGVFSTQASGAPGAALNINVRGITSPVPKLGSLHQSNVPLYVIDGLPYFVESSSLNPLAVISPNDIESIDVLKDASATAIYGSRGANGVIIVKTKNGRKGDKVSIDAGYTFSIGNPIKEYKPLSVAEYKQLQNTIIKGTLDYAEQTNGGYLDDMQYEGMNVFGDIDAEFDWDMFMYKFNSYGGLRESAFGDVHTNWVDETTNRNAGAHQYYMSLRGGSEKTNYSASINALNQEGLQLNDEYNRYGMRLALDTEITSAISGGATLSYSASKRNSGELQVGYGSGITPWRMRPDMPVFDENGDFMRFDESALYGGPVLSPNPVAARSLKTKYTGQQFIGSAYLDVDIMKGLRARGEINVSSFAFQSSYFTPSHAGGIFWGIEPEAQLSEYTSQATYASLNARLDYNTSIDVHNIAAMVGVGSDRTWTEGRSYTAVDFFNETVLNNIGSANTYYPISDSYSNGGLNSAYSRFSYDYDRRFLAELSIRGDVSSKFGPENRLGVFPAVSLGWRMKNESFLMNVDQVDDLKLRLSWGKTGSTNVEDFSYLQYYSKQGKYAGSPIVRLEGNLPNQQVRWEITSEYNGGIDFSFFNRRLYGSLDIYSRYTKGALTNSPFMMESGMGTFSSNLIDMSNKGFEFELGGDIIRSKDFSWSTNFNISSNKNVVEKLNGANLNIGMEDVIVEGHPVGVLRGYKVIEIVNDQAVIDKLNDMAQEKGHAYYQADLGIGDFLMEDTNNDGRINSDDRVVIGSPIPKFFGGWNNRFSIKNVELSFLMQFSQGGKASYSDIYTDLWSTLGNSITRETFGNTWTPESPNAKYPRLVAYRYDGYNARYNDRYLFSTSYLRMKNITLSYNLNNAITEKLHLQNASLFTSITNLFTITKWPGLDPELVGVGVYGGDSNEDPYPLSRTFSVGFRVQF